MKKLIKLFLTLKGSAGSGNYSHVGRPGKHGGSQPGGGLVALGIDSSSKPQERKQLASVNRRLNQVKLGVDSDLKNHYKLNERCGNDVDCKGIKNYVGEGYRSINDKLRSPGKYTKNLNSIKSDIKSIDKALDQLPRTKEEMKVTRRISNYIFAKTMIEGSEFVDKGYVSTSIKPGGPSKVFGNIKIEIIVPKGSKGAYLEGSVGVSGENEFLLPRNSKFKVLRNDYQNPKSEYENSIVLEYLGET